GAHAASLRDAPATPDPRTLSLHDALPISLSVSPTSVFVNGAVTAAWSGTAGPSGANWLGLYNPGAPSTGFYLYSSAGASGASGRVGFAHLGTAGTGRSGLRPCGGGQALLA